MYSLPPSKHEKESLTDKMKTEAEMHHFKKKKKKERKKSSLPCAVCQRSGWKPAHSSGPLPGHAPHICWQNSPRTSKTTAVWWRRTSRPLKSENPNNNNNTHTHKKNNNEQTRLWTHSPPANAFSVVIGGILTARSCLVSYSPCWCDSYPSLHYNHS